MADEQKESFTDISRRDFVTLSVTAAAGLAVGTGTSSAAAVAVVEENVTIKTADGMCDAAFIHPTTGAHSAVLIWPDAFGLRPVMREIGKRIAGEGYSVLVPNPFYRLAKAPVFDDPSKFNFANPADMAKLQPLMGSINAPGAAERDATAFIAWLDTQRQVHGVAHSEIVGVVRVAQPIDHCLAIGLLGECLHRLRSDVALFAKQ